MNPTIVRPHNGGVPLRKFGAFRVYKHSMRTSDGAHVYYSLYDDRDGFCVMHSVCKESVVFIGNRLAAGEMVTTPAELEARTIELSPGYYPTRHWYLNFRYLGDHVRRWINGGPVIGLGVVLPTEIALALEKKAKDRTEELERLGKIASLLAELRAGNEAEDARVRAIYAAGTWPDVDEDPPGVPSWKSLLRGHRALHQINDDSILGSLLTADAANTWIDAGREATRLLLRYGVDDTKTYASRGWPVPPSRANLTALAEKLAAKYGGDWHP